MNSRRNGWQEGWQQAMAILTDDTQDSVENFSYPSSCCSSIWLVHWGFPYILVINFTFSQSSAYAISSIFLNSVVVYCLQQPVPSSISIERMNIYANKCAQLYIVLGAANTIYKYPHAPHIRICVTQRRGIIYGRRSIWGNISWLLLLAVAPTDERMNGWCRNPHFEKREREKKKHEKRPRKICVR